MWLRDFEGETTGTVAEFLKAHAGLSGSTVPEVSTPWARVEAWENLVTDDSGLALVAARGSAHRDR